MKRCLACQSCYAFAETVCPLCGLCPVIHEGFSAYAPEQNRGGQGFSVEAYRYLATTEAGSFWFRARNRLIVRALHTYCSEMESFLEIGCGTGFVLSGIRQAFPDLRICGSEIATDGLTFAAERLPGVPLMQMDARRIPFFEEFDGIGAFDVLEHIDEDEEAIKEVHTALRPGGFFALTVPQHTWLWSATDDEAKHIRRYTRQELHSKLTGSGFRILRSTSFVSLLLPAMVFSRLTPQKQTCACELNMPPLLNALCSSCMRLEEMFIHCGLSLPLGGSRLVIAQRVA